MFNKEYPKSCTMINMSFGPKYNVDYKYFVVTGSWSCCSGISYSARILYTNATNSIRGRRGMIGFRGSIYVQ
jgi:hypothetical protein